MANSDQFMGFVLDQLMPFGDFETKDMFGGTALMKDGVAFAKIKRDSLWLKVDESNIDDFLEHQMIQYTYGKDNSRKLNFYETPADVLEDREQLVIWANKAFAAAIHTRK